MKKIMLMVVALLGASFAHGALLGDQITASLIDHVAAQSQWTTKGENRLALLSSVVQIGRLDGKAIGQLRFGFTGITNPEGGVDRGAGYVADGYLNISPLIRRYVRLSPEWTFLNSIEAGPSYGYDFRDHHGYLAFSVGLAFGLSPK